MDTKKLMGIALGVFTLFFIVTHSTKAADITHAAWHVTVTVAYGTANFIDKL
jgi:hypothetical protein